MGHYASEMSSTWSESIDWSNRVSKLKKNIASISLDNFKARHVVLLQKLFHATEFLHLNEKEIEELEKVVLIYRRKQKL